MRKFLLASVATLGTGIGRRGSGADPTRGAGAGTSIGTSADIGQSAHQPGQQAWPAAPSPTAYVNNNNNYQAPTLPGAVANPTPGTIVVHFNGKVQIDVSGTWTSLDNHLVTATARRVSAMRPPHLPACPVAPRSPPARRPPLQRQSATTVSAR